MPNIHVPLPETQQNISRPAVIKVVKQVQEITGMKDTQIYFPDEEGKVHTNSGTIDSKENQFAGLTSKRMNRIVVEEEMDRDEISPTFFNGKEYPPIFFDPALGVSISPVYAKHNVTVEFNYSCTSKTEAEKWLQDVRMKIARLKDINLHSIEYHYNLHKVQYDIIKVVHTLRETQSGYGQTLEQYLKLHATPRLTVIGDLINKDTIFAIAERQIEIVGIYGFDALPSKPVKDAESGMWVIAFTYKFNYDKPIGCHMKYPIIVHNQLMPLSLVDFTSEEVRPIAMAQVESSRTQDALRMFRADCNMDKMKAEDGMLLIPPFDDFHPSSLRHYTAGIIQGLVQVDPEKPRDLLNLTDLGDIALDDDIIQFFKEVEFSYLTKPSRSIFGLELYQDGYLQNWHRMTVDSQLNVRYTDDLDIRKQYRVRLSVVTDIDKIDNAAFIRLRNYPTVIHKVTRVINRAFRENPEMNKLGMTRYISEIEFDAIYRGLLGKENSFVSTISWCKCGLARQYGIDQKLIDKLRRESRSEMRTMVMGVIAHRKDSKALHEPAIGCC